MKIPNTMQSLALLLILAGLLLGPGYWIFSQVFSGRLVARVPVSVSDDGHLLAEPIELRPGMAPLALVLVAQAEFKPHQEDWMPPEDQYRVTLWDEQRAVAESTLLFQAPSVAHANPVFREALLRLDEVPLGRYRLQAQPATLPEMKLRHAEIEIRERVWQANPRLAGTGVVLLISGILALFL